MLDIRYLWNCTRRFDRLMCMRAKYLAEDRPDVRFACKEIARLMGEPCEAGWESSRGWDDTWQAFPDLCSEWSDKIPRAVF